MRKTVLIIFIPVALIFGFWLVRDKIALLPKASAQTSGPIISNITDNTATYSGSLVPKYEKLEITFQISSTTATNLQMPYDASPPAGVTPKIGITVNGEFSQDNFQTVYTQPAFYYQDFDYQVKGSFDWIYPKDQYSWKVRFSPNREGGWVYRIRAEDVNGITVSESRHFSVISSANKGFVRVSANDKRYFEYEDGTYFPGLGYNMNYRQISWLNPVQDNQTNFQIMQQNGIQFIRHWLSQWPIYGSSGSPWNSIIRGADYKSMIAVEPRVPDFKPYPGSDFSISLQSGWNPHMMIGWESQPPAVKRSTKYNISIRYLIPQGFSGPRQSGLPFGLTAKIGGWLDRAQDPGIGTVVADYTTVSPKDSNGVPQWSELAGTFTTRSNQDFMDYFYLVLENTVSDFPAGGVFAYIDRVEIREDLGSDQLGPNIIPKPWMAHHLYYNQEGSYRFDKVMELAEQYDIYLKLAVLEKNDFVFNYIDYDGNTFPDDSRCWDSDPNNNPSRCPSNNWYYGNWGNMTKVYWLQQAWWRYIQARWGYSPNIHSWELNNEGDPFNGLHYTLANNFAKYMHQFTPNYHLVTTSLWHSIPYDQFWAYPNFQELDYLDSHLAYKQNGATETIRVDYQGSIRYPTIYVPSDFYDTALYNYKAGQLYGTFGQYGIQSKPVTRGESGFYTSDANSSQAGIFSADTTGIWLHKWIWGMSNSFGVYDASYWYPNSHIYGGNYRNFSFDHRNIFKPYYEFIKDIPLSNGNYKEASASATDSNLRVWGQKDVINGKAHLWIDNKTHTWGNVVSTPSAIVAASGSVTFSGMPKADYTVSWYDTYTGTTSQTETVSVANDGVVTLALPSTLSTDIAVKVEANSLIEGDINGDNQVDLFDVQMLFNNWNTPIDRRADINNDNVVNGVDFGLIMKDWGD